MIYSIFLMKQINMLYFKTTKMTSWAVDAQEVMRSTLTWVKKKKTRVRFQNISSTINGAVIEAINGGSKYVHFN